MKALVYGTNCKLDLVEIDTPVLEHDDDVIVKIVQTGICGTDRSILVGKFTAKDGTILGHESVGQIAAVGTAMSSLIPGQRVVINPTLYCGQCQPCLQGNLNFCANKSGNEVGVDRHGAFAEYICLPAKFCHVIPDTMSFDRAVLIEPLACALNNLDAANLIAGETVVVMGGGPMGVITSMLALFMGAKVWMVEPDPFRRQTIQKIFHDNLQFNLVGPEDADVKGVADVVIESVGNLLESALAYAKVRGRIVIMGYNDKAALSLKPLDVLMRGLRIIGAGDYNSHIFPRAINLASMLPLEKIITDRFNLENYHEAFSSLSILDNKPYSALKVLIVMDQLLA